MKTFTKVLAAYCIGMYALAIACKPAVDALDAPHGQNIADFEKRLQECQNVARDAGKDAMVQTFDRCWAERGLP